MVETMSKHGSRAASLLLGVLSWQALRVSAECAYRFEGTNFSEPQTWVVPSADSFASDYAVLNEHNPIVYLSNSESDETELVNCTGTSWRYLLASGAYATELTFPDSGSETTTTSVAFESLFNATEGDLLVSAIPDSMAVAVSDSLFGRTVELTLTCNQEDILGEGDSCVEFKVNFTNSSPLPDAETALYRFTDPAVPGVVMPPSGNSSPGDIQLNEGNPIVQLDGTDVEVGCNGDKAEYLGEDGEWYFWFTGSDGLMYNLTHVFYATEQDHLNIATIQRNWSPNLEAALYNRTVRLLIYCNNINEREEGHIFFTVGNGSSLFDYSCEDFPCLCDGDVDDGCTNAAHGRHAQAGFLRVGGGGWWAGAVHAFMTAGLVSVLVGKLLSPPP